MVVPKTGGKVVQDFQEKRDVQLMLLSLQAGGTGLNLTAADHVYLLDPWWNPAAEAQAADRASSNWSNKTGIYPSSGRERYR